MEMAEGPHLPDETRMEVRRLLYRVRRELKVVADAEARHTGKTYLAASAPQPSPAIYVFASDHPDAGNASIALPA